MAAIHSPKASDMCGNNLDEFLVCPGCGLVHDAHHVDEDEVGSCHRCEMEFVFPEPKRFDHTVALAVTSLLLIAGALYFPFLTISRASFSNELNLPEITTSFTNDWFLLIGLSFGLFVVLVPIWRAFVLIYVLTPIWLERPVFKHAKLVFRTSEQLSAWGMVDIFFVATAVSLIKLLKLADVDFQFSFWLLALLVINNGVMNYTLHRKSIWKLL